MYSFNLGVGRRLGIVALAVAMTGAAWEQRTAYAFNELLNPGFETDAVENQEPVFGATDWFNQGTGIQSTVSAPLEPVRSGIGSLQLVSELGGYGVPLMVQTLPAAPGQQWDLQGYMLQKDQLPAGNTFAILKIVFDDGGLIDPEGLVHDLEPAKVNIGAADAQPYPGIVSAPQFNSTSAVNTWVFAHAQGVAPADTVNVRLFCLLVDENPSTVYFDDIQLLLAGDFDGDKDIDADDLPIWKGAVGISADGDADGDGDSDGADFLLWQSSQSVTTVAIAAAGGVPEPATATMAVLGLMLAAARGRGRRL